MNERTVREGSERLLNAPLVLLLGLALPGEDGDTGGGDGSGGVVLGGEDVARRPGDLGSDGSEGLDEDGAVKGKKKENGMSQPNCQRTLPTT